MGEVFCSPNQHKITIKSSSGPDGMAYGYCFTPPWHNTLRPSPVSDYWRSSRTSSRRCSGTWDCPGPSWCWPWFGPRFTHCRLNSFKWFSGTFFRTNFYKTNQKTKVTKRKNCKSCVSCDIHLKKTKARICTIINSQDLQFRKTPVKTMHILHNIFNRPALKPFKKDLTKSRLEIDFKENFLFVRLLCGIDLVTCMLITTSLVSRIKQWYFFLFKI